MNTDLTEESVSAGNAGPHEVTDGKVQFAGEVAVYSVSRAVSNKSINDSESVKSGGSLNSERRRQFNIFKNEKVSACLLSLAQCSLLFGILVVIVGGFLCVAAYNRKGFEAIVLRTAAPIMIGIAGMFFSCTVAICIATGACCPRHKNGIVGKIGVQDQTGSAQTDAIEQQPLPDSSSQSQQHPLQSIREVSDISESGGHVVKPVIPTAFLTKVHVDETTQSAGAHNQLMAAKLDTMQSSLATANDLSRTTPKNITASQNIGPSHGGSVGMTKTYGILKTAVVQQLQDPKHEEVEVLEDVEDENENSHA